MVKNTSGSSATSASFANRLGTRAPSTGPLGALSPKARRSLWRSGRSQTKSLSRTRQEGRPRWSRSVVSGSDDKTLRLWDVKTGQTVRTFSGHRDLVFAVAFWFARPSGIQAAPPVSPFRVPNERQQWGGALGGPVRQNRTFLFGTYERVQQERGSYIQSPMPGMFTGRLDEWYALARLDERWSDTHTSSVRLNGNFSRNNNSNDRVGGFTQPSAAQLSKQQAAGAVTHTSMTRDGASRMRASGP